MKYYSTNNKHHRVSLRDAVINGLAPDGGLYMPESIPRLSDDVLSRISSMSLSEVGFDVMRPFLEDEIADSHLRRMLTETFSFETPLVPIGNQHVLELFHGPTLAFKDVGARFLARLMAEFVRKDQDPLTILVATSGDTGSAVANGFYRVPNVRVVVLFPKGKVSPIQEKQMTTLGENIVAVAVDGTFDDCQRLVKEAFVDEELRASIRLSSANSINIARLLPQAIYFFWAAARKPGSVFSVPSGNFGNLTAGLLAKRMGAPIDHFIAATNENDVIPEYLQTGRFRPRPSVATISNAMDVGSPSNFARMLDLYEHSIEVLRQDVTGQKITEQETLATIADVSKKDHYVLDPHGAVGYAALIKQGMNGIVLETAHPAKFQDTMTTRIGIRIELPELFQLHATQPSFQLTMQNNYHQLKRILQK